MAGDQRECFAKKKKKRGEFEGGNRSKTVGKREGDEGPTDLNHETVGGGTGTGIKKRSKSASKHGIPDREVGEKRKKEGCRERRSKDKEEEKFQEGSKGKSCSFLCNNRGWGEGLHRKFKIGGD